MSELQKIRIRLKAYDHALLDKSAAKIVELSLIHISDHSDCYRRRTEIRYQRRRKNRRFRRCN